MTIGERIKLFRKKNDLTQEKLADYLCVSYQAVSKWECGIASPDLSLIIPLTRVLKVSADELFGLNEKVSDKLEQELEQTYDTTFKNGDLEKRLEITEAAIKEFPGDMKWLNRHAWDVWCVTVSEDDNEKYNQQREKAIKLFKTVIENCDEDEIKCHAITGIVQCLRGVDNEQAKYYAELYPETKIRPQEKEDLIASCLTGDERRKCEQHILDGYLDTILDKLLWHFDSFYKPDMDARNAAESIIKAIITDGNYQHYHHHLFNIKLRNASDEAFKGNADAAVRFLKETVYHAIEYGKLETKATKYSFTTALFDKLEYDSGNWCKTGKDTLLDELKDDFLNRTQFNILRERQDFKELIK